MNDEDKKLLHATQCGEIYMAYGEFCVRFERLSDRISSSIATLLLTEGLTNYNIANILLSGLTANPLVELYNIQGFKRFCIRAGYRKERWFGKHGRLWTREKPQNRLKPG